MCKSSPNKIAAKPSPPRAVFSAGGGVNFPVDFGEDSCVNFFSKIPFLLQNAQKNEKADVKMYVEDSVDFF